MVICVFFTLEQNKIFNFLLNPAIHEPKNLNSTTLSAVTSKRIFI